MRKPKRVRIEVLREAVANYMSSEGCDCCRDREAHQGNEEVLGKLLDVEKYDDDSGYNFFKYRTDARKEGKDE